MPSVMESHRFRSSFVARVPTPCLTSWMLARGFPNPSVSECLCPFTGCAFIRTVPVLVLHWSDKSHGCMVAMRLSRIVLTHPLAFVSRCSCATRCLKVHNQTYFEPCCTRQVMYGMAI